MLIVVVDEFEVFSVYLGDVVALDSARMYWLSGPVLSGVGITIFQPRNTTFADPHYFARRSSVGHGGR